MAAGTYSRSGSGSVHEGATDYGSFKAQSAREYLAPDQLTRYDSSKRAIESGGLGSVHQKKLRKSLKKNKKEKASKILSKGFVNMEAAGRDMGLLQDVAANKALGNYNDQAIQSSKPWQVSAKEGLIQGESMDISLPEGLAGERFKRLQPAYDPKPEDASPMASKITALAAESRGLSSKPGAGGGMLKSLGARELGGKYNKMMEGAANTPSAVSENPESSPLHSSLKSIAGGGPASEIQYNKYAGKSGVQLARAKRREVEHSKYLQERRFGQRGSIGRYKEYAASNMKPSDLRRMGA